MSTTRAVDSSIRQRAPRKPAPSLGVILGLVVVVAVTIWAGRAIEFTLRPLITDLTRGQAILVQFVPNWSYLTRSAVIEAALTTLYMAIIASVIGCALGLIAALLASKVSAPNTVVYQIAKAVMSAVRSLPDIAYGLLFVAFVGTGALGGIAALIMFNICTI